MTPIIRSLGFSFICLALLPAAQAAETFKVTQGIPEIAHVDLGAPGATHGDLMAFEAPFETDDGKSGVMSGLITTVSIPIENSNDFLDRIGHIVMAFGGVDSLIVSGKSMYPSGQSEMDPNAAQVRAVTGGTGRFIGARGQITTTRLDAGHYEHLIELVD